MASHFKKKGLLPPAQVQSTDPYFTAMQNADAPQGNAFASQAIGKGYKKLKIAGSASFADPGAWSSLVKTPSV